MVEDESSNTLCIGRVIHTPTTPGLITRTYMLPKHYQTSIFLTPLQLDNQQYKKRPLKSPRRILIPTSLWLFSTSQHPRQSTVHFASTIQTHFTPSITSLIAQQCLVLLPPSSSHLARPLPSTAPATPPTLSHLLLLTVQPAWRWPFPMNK